jgi:hypothetical protein
MDAVRDAIEAQWPEVGANGVWETADIREETFDDRTPPFAVMQVEEDRDDPDFSGLNNAAFRCILSIWRVQREEGGVDLVREKLQDLERAFFDTELGYGQFLGPLGHNTDGSNIANVILREKLLPYYGGCLRAEFTYGETI